jgi:hypothetical protein
MAIGLPSTASQKSRVGGHRQAVQTLECVHVKMNGVQMDKCRHYPPAQADVNNRESFAAQQVADALPVAHLLT